MATKTQKENKKISLKDIGNKILSYFAGSITGILPVLIASAMCKMVNSLIGPDILNLVTKESDLYQLFVFLDNAFFYFLPIYLGYSAAKVLKTDISLGIYVGAMIIVPGFVALVGTRDTFSVFGISVPVANYGQTFLPVMLGVWIMSYVYRFFNRVIPDFVKMIVVPLLTIIVMTPVMFAVCAPLGAYIGNAIASLFISMSNANIVLRIIGSVLLSALYAYIVLFGMHAALYVTTFAAYFANGYESFVLPLGYVYSWAIIGLSLGALIKFKQKENKGLAMSCFVSQILGGVSEPTLYGIGLKYKIGMIVLMISGAIGGLISAIIQVNVYTPVMCNIFTSLLVWTGGGTANLIKGIVLMAVSFVVALGSTILFADFGED